jgi:hypothetical protein
MEVKICSNKSCAHIGMQPLEAFNKSSRAKDGRQQFCKVCSNLKKKEWYLANKDKELTKIRNYQQDNRAHLAQKHNEYTKLRKRQDPTFKIACNLRTRVNEVISGKNKKGSAIKDLGCSVRELKTYLESKFQPGMTWDNHSQHGWHLDHIKPLVDFNLEDTEQFKQACHYTNLQPLWAEDHVVKTAIENQNRVK